MEESEFVAALRELATPPLCIACDERPVEEHIYCGTEQALGCKVAAALSEKKSELAVLCPEGPNRGARLIILGHQLAGPLNIAHPISAAKLARFWLRSPGREP
jgi:hypothetical protein